MLGAADNARSIAVASASRSSTVSELLSPVVPPMKTILTPHCVEMLGLLFDRGQIQLAVGVKRCVSRGDQAAELDGHSIGSCADS